MRKPRSSTRFHVSNLDIRLSPKTRVLRIKRDISTTKFQHLAQVREEKFSSLWFTSSVDLNGRGTPGQRVGRSELQSVDVGQSSDDKRPPDERTLKLGKTLRTLSPLLPTLLTSPHSIPPTILSPKVALHLFPSTHPHLPTVHGKVPYRAALWTAPVAWGSFPIVGNAKLQILSETMGRTAFISRPTTDGGLPPGTGEEKLVVRWKTRGKDGKPNTASTAASSSSTSSASSDLDSPKHGTGINRSLSLLLGGDKPIFNLSADNEFSGLFVFTFDEDGRVADHTIEHAEEGNGTDKTSRVVTLADWLLGQVGRGRPKEEEQLLPGLAFTGQGRGKLELLRQRKTGHET